MVSLPLSASLNSISCLSQDLGLVLFSLYVYRMCADNTINTLMRLDFAGLADEVEDALAFKARNVDPLIQPS